MDRNFLYENLVEWIRSFDFVSHDIDINFLLDGEILAEILFKIEPTYFNDEWKSKFTFDSTSNWRLKASNLKKITNTMSDFLRKNLNFTLENFQFPDINLICEKNDIVEMSRLLQLVLLCAVNCTRKETYIQNIMSLESTVQMVIMKAIQELMDNEATLESALSEEKLSASTQHLQALQIEKEELKQRCHDQDKRISLLEDEKASLEAELTKYRKHTVNSNSTDTDIVSNSNSNQASLGSMSESVRIRQLQEKVANLQNEIYSLEHLKYEQSQKLMDFESENVDLKQKMEELGEKLVDQRHLKDELDIARERLKSLSNMESTLEKYKKHIDQNTNLVQQNQELEIENSKYLERVIKLEEEIRIVSSLKSQIEMYKKEITDIQSQCSKKEKDLNKSEFDLKRAQEKMKALEMDKRNLQEELKKVKEENEDLHVTSYTIGSESGSEPNSESHDLPYGMTSSVMSTSQTEESIDLMQIPYQMREKVIRLQKEVRQLRQFTKGDDSSGLERNDNSGDSSEFAGKSREQLVVSLEAAQARIHQLSTENKQLYQDHLVLNAKIEDGDPTRFHGITAENQKVVAKLKSELENTEFKYKGYLEKAKYVIFQLHQKLIQLEQEKKVGSEELEESPPTPTGEQDASFAIDNKEVITRADYEALKKAFFEKERQYDELHKQFERAQSLREEEEKMMVAAWYNLGIRVHREAAQDRLRYHHSNQYGTTTRSSTDTLDGTSSSASTIAATSGGTSGIGHSGEPSSFLARQRLAHLTTTNNSQHNNLSSNSSLGD